MRGARCRTRTSVPTAGIIPADAGSTVVRVGKHDKLAGSSPRMRGALTATVSPVPRERDHPRGCGEHAPGPAARSMTWGSSPRMRGALGDGGIMRLVRRIIPADAGSTKTGLISGNDGPDHPRGCGEHWNWINAHVITPGSSPRMRGAHRDRLIPVSVGGIIPADAGSTPATRPTRPRSPDHPRGCGEHE